MLVTGRAGGGWPALRRSEAESRREGRWCEAGVAGANDSSARGPALPGASPVVNYLSDMACPSSGRQFFLKSLSCFVDEQAAHLLIPMQRSTIPCIACTDQSIKCVRACRVGRCFGAWQRCQPKPCYIARSTQMLCVVHMPHTNEPNSYKPCDTYDYCQDEELIVSSWAGRCWHGASNVPWHL